MPTTFFTKGNRVYSTLDGSLTDIALSCVVTTATGYNDHPATNHTIQIGDDSQGYEIMTATSSGGANPTLTIVRAREGTGALPFNAGTDVKLVITAAQVVEYETAINLRVEQAASSTDHAIARFDGVGGDLVQNSKCVISDDGALKVDAAAASVIAFEGESGNANNYCAWSLGRTAAEFQAAVIHQVNSWYNPSAVGDGVISVLDNTKSLRLGVGSGVAQLAITNTAATLSGSLTLGLGAANQDYLFTNRGTAVLAIVAQNAGVSSLVELFSADGDGTDDVKLVLYGKGTEAGIVDRERLLIGYENTGTFFEIQSEADGTGTLRPIKIWTEGNANQLLLAIDGTVSTASDFTVGGDLTVTGNNILDAGAAAGITFDGAGNTAIDGDLTVTGNNIKDAGAAAGITFDGAGNTAIDGDLTVTGNDIKDSGGTAVTFDGSQNTTLAGNLTITNTKTILRGQSIISQAITWDGGATQACATVADGYIVTDVYIEITTTFDGDAVVTVGDGADDNGFLTDAGINQGVAGYYGYDISTRGVYLISADRKIYTGADTVDAFVTETTATQGAATVYTIIQRLK